ncbi:MAG: CoA-binding protein [Candidatus Methylomirabilales bacterium]
MAILIDEETTILVQGITGREGAALTRDSLEYGAKVLAGVTPGKGGRTVHGVPVYDTVHQALDRHRCTAAVIAVPSAAARDAALEAIWNGIPLIVIVTERIPRRDTVEILALAARRGTRVVGPNSLGLIAPDRTKVGMVGGPAADVRKAYRRGPVGVISRSGGMTTEIANLLSLHGIGQSTCVSIGGDPMVGSSYSDLVPLFAKDPETAAVVLFCEPGGSAEEHWAEGVLRQGTPLPIIAFVAGCFADRMPGTRFGHAAVIVEGTRGSTAGKIAAFRRAGVLVAEEFSDIVPLLKKALGRKHPVHGSQFTVHGGR